MPCPNTAPATMSSAMMSTTSFFMQFLLSRNCSVRAPDGSTRTRRRELLSHLDGELETAGPGDSLVRDVVRGSVVDRGAHDRQPERCVDASVEVQRLHRYVALIVVHADDRVESIPVQCIVEDGVCRFGPVRVDLLGARLFDRRHNLLR